jgi:regulator of protease activity HflC (stomatin/prohibitin superfamily)
VFGQFNAVAAVQERARLDAQVEQAVMKAVTGPVVVESVQIENIDFSDAYEESIEQRMLAEVEVQRIQQNAERERVQAEIVVIQAAAEADAIRARGQAEADAINARGEALGNNPELVSLIAAEKWNGVLPTTMLPGSTVPFVAVPNR